MAAAILPASLRGALAGHSLAFPEGSLRMPHVMHWPAHARPGWRGWLPAAGLACALHLALFWSMTEHASTPRFQTAERISVTMLKLAAPTAKAAAPAATAEPPAPTPTVERVSRPSPRPEPKPKPARQQATKAPAPAPVAKPHEPPAPKSSVQGNRPDSEPDHSAAFLNNPAPTYPRAALRRGWQGRVILDVEVLASGLCGRIRILHSSGHEILDREALATVKQWHFIPAHIAGLPVDRWYQVPVKFRLQNGR